MKNIYPEPKSHDLSDAEKEAIRNEYEDWERRLPAQVMRSEQGKITRQIAKQFGCSWSQVSGIVAAMHR